MFLSLYFTQETGESVLGVPGVIGYIDGSHIPIVSVGSDNAEI